MSKFTAMTTSSQRVILVTGGNRGIGFAIVKSIAQHAQKSPMTILMSCRDLETGKAAIEVLATSGITNVKLVQLDVTTDSSIRNVASTIEQEYGRLDVLINNAGYAAIPSSEDFSDLRQNLQDIYNVNVSSVAVLTRILLPLLRKSYHGAKVIQVGSGRGSMTLLANGKLPPTVVLGYSISKTALNALTLQMAIEPENQMVEFQVASPGHCRTAFNGYRGTRDPEEGAIVVVELVFGERRETKCWETVGADRELKELPW